MELPSYNTPEGALNVLLGGLIAVSLLFGLLFAGIYLGIVPQV
jgi:hypothetical protein